MTSNHKKGFGAQFKLNVILIPCLFLFSQVSFWSVNAQEQASKGYALSSETITKLLEVDKTPSGPLSAQDIQVIQDIKSYEKFQSTALGMALRDWELATDGLSWQENNMKKLAAGDNSLSYDINEMRAWVGGFVAKRKKSKAAIEQCLARGDWTGPYTKDKIISEISDGNVITP